VYEVWEEETWSRVAYRCGEECAGEQKLRRLRGILHFDEPKNILILKGPRKSQRPSTHI
jgi:hypothetical protein